MIYGVSFDTPAENQNFANNFHFNFPLLCDVDHEIGLAYGAAETDKDEYARRIAYVIDENGRIEEAHAKVDPASYPADQLASLQSSGKL